MNIEDKIDLVIESAEEGNREVIRELLLEMFSEGYRLGEPVVKYGDHRG